eukprot:1049254_1
MNGHRNGICQNKGGCRTAAHFNDECKDDNNSNFSYYVIDCIDDVDVDGTEAEVKYLDTLLCRLERKCQAQLGTIWNGINGTYLSIGIIRRNILFVLGNYNSMS